MEEQAARLKEVRTALGMSREKFCAKLGVSSGVIVNIELGRVAPKQPFLNLVCDVYGVNPEWMETGTGEMFTVLPEDEQLAASITKILYREPESLRARVISVITRLDEADLEVLVHIAQQLAEANED